MPLTYKFGGEWNSLAKDSCKEWMKEKLTVIQGESPEDLFLEYILVMIGNRKRMEELSQQLQDFIGDQEAKDFAAELGIFLQTISANEAKIQPIQTEEMPQGNSAKKVDILAGGLKSGRSSSGGSSQNTSRLLDSALRSTTSLQKRNGSDNQNYRPPAVVTSQTSRQNVSANATSVGLSTKRGGQSSTTTNPTQIGGADPSKRRKIILGDPPNQLAVSVSNNGSFVPNNGSFDDTGVIDPMRGQNLIMGSGQHNQHNRPVWGGQGPEGPVYGHNEQSLIMGRLGPKSVSNSHSLGNTGVMQMNTNSSRGNTDALPNRYTGGITEGKNGIKGNISLVGQRQGNNGQGPMMGHMGGHQGVPIGVPMGGPMDPNMMMEQMNMMAKMSGFNSVEEMMAYQQDMASNMRNGGMEHPTGSSTYQQKYQHPTEGGRFGRGQGGSEGRGAYGGRGRGRGREQPGRGHFDNSNMVNKVMPPAPPIGAPPQPSGQPKQPYTHAPPAAAAAVAPSITVPIAAPKQSIPVSRVQGSIPTSDLFANQVGVESEPEHGCIFSYSGGGGPGGFRGRGRGRGRGRIPGEFEEGGGGGRGRGSYRGRGNSMVAAGSVEGSSAAPPKVLNKFVWVRESDMENPLVAGR